MKRGIKVILRKRFISEFLSSKIDVFYSKISGIEKKDEEKLHSIKILGV